MSVHRSPSAGGTGGPARKVHKEDISPPSDFVHVLHTGREAAMRLMSEFDEKPDTSSGSSTIKIHKTISTSLGSPSAFSFLQDPHEPSLPLPDQYTQQTAQRSVATKIWLENYFDGLLKASHDRSARVEKLEEQLESLSLPNEAKDIERKKHFQKETDYMRLRRIKVTSSNFLDIQVIGKGAFGMIKLVQERETGNLYAMKVLKKSEMIRRRQEGHVRAERDLLVSAGHSESIVQLYQSFQDKDYLYLVLEYMAGGDLLTLLINKQIFPEEFAKFYMAEMVLAISEVHRLGFIHRDVKPDNFLLNSDGHLKVSDFGLCTGFDWRHDAKFYEAQRRSTARPDKIAEIVDEYSAKHSKNLSAVLREAETEPEISLEEWRKQDAKKIAFSVVGTNNYIAPEVLLQCGYNKECDYWSLGVILYEMIYGFPPFYSDSRQKTKLKIVNWTKTLKFPPRKNISPEAIDLIQRLITDPGERLGVNGVEEVITHPFFKGIEWEHLLRSTPPWRPDLISATDTKYFDVRHVKMPSASPEARERASTTAASTAPVSPTSPFAPSLYSTPTETMDDMAFFGFTHRAFQNLTRRPDFSRREATRMDPLQAAVLSRLQQDDVSSSSTSNSSNGMLVVDPSSGDGNAERPTRSPSTATVPQLQRPPEGHAKNSKKRRQNRSSSM